MTNVFRQHGARFVIMHLSEKYTGHTDYRSAPIITYPAKDISGDTIIEIGPGRGDFLFHLAETNPDKVIFGIELKGRRFDKLVERREKRGMGNIKLIMADAKIALPELFADGSVTAIYINFPDPWPKRRHASHRLLQRHFIEECARALIPGGFLSITTDVECYAREVFELCKELPQLVSLTPCIATDSSDIYPTLFAKKWQALGRTIYYQKWGARPLL